MDHPAFAASFDTAISAAAMARCSFKTPFTRHTDWVDGGCVSWSASAKNAEKAAPAGICVAMAERYGEARDGLLALSMAWICASTQALARGLERALAVVPSWAETAAGAAAGGQAAPLERLGAAALDLERRLARALRGRRLGLGSELRLGRSLRAR